jgi:hypothetical protein
MTDSAKTAEYADEVAPARVETLMARHAVRRWILEVRLHRRVDEVFFAPFRKKDAVVMWIDFCTNRSRRPSGNKYAQSDSQPR